MHSVYLIAPDVTSSAIRTVPTDGDVDWRTTGPPLDRFDALVDELSKLARNRGPVNVLRIKAHGDSGSVAVFGDKSTTKLDFAKPGVLDAVRKLQGIFDRRPGARREIYLHACYAASDTPQQCESIPGVKGGYNCGILGYTAPPEQRGAQSPGFALLQGLANTTNVPVIGTVDLLPYYDPYDWTFPGRVLYVYPGGGVVTFAGIWFEGKFAGILPPGSDDKVNEFKKTELEIPFLLSAHIAHPLIERSAGSKWLAWCSGTINVKGSLHDWRMKARLSVSGDGGYFTIDCDSVEASKGDTISKAPIPFQFHVVRGTGDFLGGHGEGLGRLDVSSNGHNFTLQFIVKRDR